MAKGTIGIGMLGCGRVAQHYRKILLSGAVSRWRVAAVSDLERAKAEDMASTFDAKVHDDAAALMADPDVDLVLILTYSGHHYDHARMALEAGKHVLVEKPVTMRPDQADALDALARSRGLMCGVAFQNRLNPAIQALRDALNEGRFGRLVTVAVRLRWCRFQDYYEDGWHGTWAMDGGVINQQAIHHVDALNWLCGPIDRVAAVHTRRLNTLEAEDTMAATFVLEDGALGTIEVTTAARPRDFEASISVVGEKGTAVVAGIALNKITEWSFIDARPEDASVPDRCSQEVETGYGISHGPLLEAVIDQLLAGGIDAPVSASDGGGTVALVHALYRSAELGAWVSLADRPLSGLLGQAA